jgi:hypothetical protein
MINLKTSTEIGGNQPPQRAASSTALVGHKLIGKKPSFEDVVPPP